MLKKKVMGTDIGHLDKQVTYMLKATGVTGLSQPKTISFVAMPNTLSPFFWKLSLLSSPVNAKMSKVYLKNKKSCFHNILLYKWN